MNRFRQTSVKAVLTAMVAVLFTLPTLALAERAPAKKGNAVTPSTFPTKLLPGIDKPGAIPKKKYFVVYSNGDMDDIWRINHVKDMEAYGNAYGKEFGMRFLWTNAGNNSEKQIEDIRSLLMLKPDLLIFSANTAALSAVYEDCQKAKVPFITVDRGIEPSAWSNKNDMYIMHISNDFMYQGVVQGAMLVEELKKKYGKPIGNVVELHGLPESEPGLQRSQGLHIVLDKFPDIRVIESARCDFDRTKGKAAMVRILKKYPKGVIDAVVGAADFPNIGAIDAIREAGRTELLGPQYGIDAAGIFMELILKDEAYMTIETPPYFGMLAFEYGVRYLNGEKIPDLLMIPMRVYSVLNKAKTKEHLELMKSQKKDFPLLEWLGHEELVYDATKYYPKSWILEPKLKDYKAFKTQKPIKQK